MSVKEIWKEIDQWLNENAENCAMSLRPPAGKEEIWELESLTKIKLENEFVESYLVHDGEAEEEGWIFSRWSLLSINNILKMWRLGCKRQADIEVGADPRVQRKIWDKAWLPFAYDGSGGFLAIDFSPTKFGAYGQIIMTSHDQGNGFVANDFLSFMKKYRDSLYANEFVYDGDELEATIDWWI